MAGIQQRFPQRLKAFLRKCTFLQCRRQPHLFAEYIFGKRFYLSALISVRFLSEKLKIPTIVKYQEPFFPCIFPVNLVNTGQIWRKPCAAAKHLPEFRFGTHFFEKHQIHTFRHVNPCVHHIHRNSHMRLLLRHFEFFDNRLGISVLAGNALCKAALIHGVQCVEPLHNQLRMFFILGKNDCFPNPVAPCNLYAAVHQILQNRIHCVHIEHKSVQRGRGDKLRYAVILRKILLIPPLVLLRKLVIHNAFFQKLRFNLIIVVRYKYFIYLNRRFIVIRIRRDTVFHLKKIVSIPVHVGFRRCSQPYKNRVKILKYRTVFLKNAPVAFVHDNQIKMCRRKQLPALPCTGIVNGVEHCRVSGKNNSGSLVVFIRAKVAQRHIRQIILEIVLCLFHKRSPIRQK